MESSGLPHPRMDWESQNLSDSWLKFERHCELMFDGPLKGKRGKERCAYILLWIGERGRTIHSSWNLSEDENTQTQTIYQKFRDFVQPKSNPVFARYKFYNERQNDDSIDEFVARLTISARNCDFEDKTDEMIRDRIVLGCTSEKVREKMIDKGKELTKENAIQIAQSFEYNQKQMAEMSSTERNIDFVTNRQQSRHRSQYIRNNRKRGNDRRPQGSHQGNDRRQQGSHQRPQVDIQCGRCGYQKHTNEKNCPAMGKTCKKCTKPNHFAKMCKSDNKNIHVVTSNSDNYSDSEGKEDFYVHTKPSSSDKDIDFDGPLRQRECRDIIFLIFFLAFIFGTGAVTFLAVSQGNPYRLIYGVDSWGNVCNQKNDPIPNVNLSGHDNSDRPYVFFFDPSYFFSLVPNNILPSITEDDTQIICVEKCPDRDVEVLDFFNDDGVSLCRYDITPYVADEEKCPNTPVVEHISKFQRCIPKHIYEQAKSTITSFASILPNVHMGGNLTETIISDLTNTWKEIGYLGCISVVVAFVIVILMRLLAAVIVWTLVIATVTLGLGASAYSWFAWYSLKEDYDALDETMRTDAALQNVETWLVYAGISTVITIVVILILLVLRKRIALVVQLYVEAGRAIAKMPLLLLQPIWTLLALIILVSALCLVGVFIENSGLPVVNKANGHVSYEMEEFGKYLRWYNLFAILWVSAFIVACQDLIIAGAVATWYFSRDKTKLGYPILRSIYNLLRYHIGSVAFGSFIIALVRLARLILSYVQKKLKGKVGKVADFIMKCLQCCLWCFDKFLCYLNRNAYIEIAIYGYSFCRSAQKAFLLIVANALRVAAINSIGDFILFLGKLATAAVILVIGNLGFFSDRDDVTYRWVPITVSCMFAFVIAHCFLLVYEITIDTIFLCFCEDCERNNGVTRPYYMSKNLMKYLDDSAKAEMKKSQAKKGEKRKK